MMDVIESEGKNVTEAVESALKKMGLTREQVEVQVLQEPSGGFMGIGSKPARVRILEKHWGEKSLAFAKVEAPKKSPSREASREIEASQKNAKKEAHVGSLPKQPARALKAPEKPLVAKQEPNKIPEPLGKPEESFPEGDILMKDLLGLMGMSGVSISSVWNSTQERRKIALSGEEAKNLIGIEGKTLESLQFIFNILLSRKLGKEMTVQVDALGYWESREKDVLANVARGVSLVKNSGAPYRLPPMNASLRRMIHKTLADHPDVQTNSEGEGAWRKIVLRPRKRN
jgi:spoIIIJ-associated protein